MKVLITGASGFIGSFLVEESLRRGYETWAGIRATSSRARLQDKRIRFIDLKYDDPKKLTEQLSEYAGLHSMGLCNSQCRLNQNPPKRELLPCQCRTHP